MVRSEALIKAQKKYRETNREKINAYVKTYGKDRYTEEAKIIKKEYYTANKERITQKYFETSIFTGFRKLMIIDYR